MCLLGDREGGGWYEVGRSVWTVFAGFGEDAGMRICKSWALSTCSLRCGTHNKDYFWPIVECVCDVRCGKRLHDYGVQLDWTWGVFLLYMEKKRR